MSYITPVDGPISQQFGSNPAPYQPGGHTGVDYAVPVGTPIRAIGSGVVRHADWASKLGWPNSFYVAIDFDGPANGDQSAGIVVIIDHGPHVSIYAHLNDTALNTGDSVTQGQIIGHSGNTGRSTGPHLHFEMLPDGWNVHNNVYGRIDPLPLLTGPEKVAANQRITAAPTNQRTAPSRSGSVVKLWDADVILDFKGYVVGEMVDGHDCWYVGAYSDTYFWSGAFTDTSITGLPNLTAAPVTPSQPAPAPAPVPAPVEPPAPAPAPEKYTFAGAFDFVEVIPAGVGNFQSGNFPEKPDTAVIHQFGTPGVDTVGSTINTFKNVGGRQVSAHFVVSGGRIIQMVDLKDRAYHAGSVGNNYIGIETDPAQDSATVASTRRLLEALRDKYGHSLVLVKHKDVPGNATACGSLVDLARYAVKDAAEASVDTREQIIEDFQDWLRAEYLKKV